MERLIASYGRIAARRPPFHLRTPAPNRALAYVLFALMLLVVVPLGIGAMVDGSQQHTLDELNGARATGGDLRALLEQQRANLQMFLATRQPAFRARYEALDGPIGEGFQKLRAAMDDLDVTGAQSAEQTRSNWAFWRTQYSPDQPGRARRMDGSAKFATLQQQLASILDRVDSARADQGAHVHWLRAAQFYITLLLAILSLFASAIVYRAQRFIVRNQNALATEQQKLQSVYDTVDVGIALWTPERNELKVNRAGLNILGCDGPEELTGKGLSFLERFKPCLPDNTPLDAERWPLNMAAAGRRFRDYEIVLQHREGRMLHMLFSGAPVLRDEKGNVTLAVSVFRDVSAQRTAERRLRDLAGINARRVRELETIIAISRDLSLQGGVERLSGYLTKQVARLFDAERCAVWVCDGTCATLHPQVPAHGFDPKAIEQAAINVRAGDWTHEVIVNDAAHIDNNVADTAFADREPSAAEYGVRSLLAVRLAASGKPLGLLAVYNKRGGARFTDEEAQLLRTFAGQAAFALHSAGLYEEAQRRADMLAWAMQETHHRIKNNLQAVSAILDVRTMETATGTVSTNVLREVLRQIRSIAVVHDLLEHNPDGGAEGMVDARDALERLAPVLIMGRLDPRVNMDLQIQDIQLPAKVVTSLALVINELVSNAMKHAARPSSRVSVRVTLEKVEQSLCLVVEDNGPGFPAGFDRRRQCGVGLDLVSMLIERDLSGTITFGAQQGGRVEARVPIMGSLS